MSEELKPCPNPGCKSKWNSNPEWNYDKSGAHWSVICACGMRGPSKLVREDADAAWNSLPRVTPAPASATDGGLGKMLCEAVKAGHGFGKIIDIIDSLPTLSTADHIAIAICGARETKLRTEGGLILHWSVFCFRLIPKKDAPDEWMIHGDYAGKNVMNDYLKSTVAAHCRAVWDKLNGQQKEKQG